MFENKNNDKTVFIYINTLRRHVLCECDETLNEINVDEGEAENRRYRLGGPQTFIVAPLFRMYACDASIRARNFLKTAHNFLISGHVFWTGKFVYRSTQMGELSRRIYVFQSQQKRITPTLLYCVVRCRVLYNCKLRNEFGERVEKYITG